MSETEALEQERQGAKNIALAIFRFRARRGIGVFYFLFSLIQLLSYYLQTVSALHNWSLLILGAAILLAWLASRMAGFTAFRQMTQSIDLVNDAEQETNGSRRKSLRAVGRDLFRVSPFAAMIVSLYFSALTLAELFLFVGVFDQLFYSILAYSRRPRDNVLRARPEDYVLIVTVVAFFVLSFIPATGRLLTFGYLSPAFLLAGIKSLYEAPEELVQTL